MTVWYHRVPHRLKAEVSLLRATTQAAIRFDGSRLTADETIAVGHHRFNYRIVFPDDFPFSPPQFHLVSPELPRLAELHIFQDGTLCLLGPSEWSPRLTAAALRARAVTWANCIVGYMASGRFVQPTRAQVRS